MIKGNTVLVIGSRPSLSTAIPKLKKYKKTVKIAADSSIKPLVENGIIPDIIVTDLDGDEKTLEKIGKTNSIFVVHAHGDNIKKLNFFIVKSKDIDENQKEKIKNAYNNIIKIKNTLKIKRKGLFFNCR